MDEVNDDLAVYGQGREEPQNIGVTWEYRIAERILTDHSEFDLVQYWDDGTMTQATLQFYTSYDALLRHYMAMNKAFNKPTITITRQ